MRKASVFPACLATLVIAAGLSGCGDADQKAKKLSQEEASIQKELAKLPDADRAAAEKQKDCPVTGEPVGSMGKIIKITVKGQDVFLCCAACEDTIREDPDTYLAKLKN